jgi:hypothetical protein
MNFTKDLPPEVARSPNTPPDDSRDPKTIRRDAGALLRDAEYRLTRKAIEMAEAGNPNVLLSLLERIYPKQRTLDVELTELCRADDAEFALKEIIKAVSSGQIALSEGKTLTTLVEALARALDATDRRTVSANLERRIKSVEATLVSLLDALRGPPQPPRP